MKYKSWTVYMEGIKIKWWQTMLLLSWLSASVFLCMWATLSWSESNDYIYIKLKQIGCRRTIQYQPPHWQGASTNYII